MNRYAAIIDACVLGGGLKRNIILSLAEAGLFRPYWSARILDETEKAIFAISKGTADPGRQRRAIEHVGWRAHVLGQFRHHAMQSSRQTQQARRLPSLPPFGWVRPGQSSDFQRR